MRCPLPVRFLLRFCAFTAGLQLSAVSVLAESVHAVTVAQGDQSIGEGIISSLSVVDGRPAVAWLNSTFSTVKFAIAADVNGEVWRAPVTLFEGSPGPQKVCLREVMGRAAVCYFDPGHNELHFLRAKDVSGSAWHPPVVIDTGAAPVSDLTMEIVDGNPALVFASRSAGELRCVRADDAGGTAWGAATVIAVNAANVRDPSLKLAADGRPAVAFASDGGLWFLLAADSKGALWSPPLRVPANTPVNGCSMEILEGKPCIAWYRQTSEAVGGLMLSHALDAAGTAWDPPWTPDRTMGPGRACSLKLIAGRPAIVYWTSLPNVVKYISAVDFAGYAWKTPVTVASEGAAADSACLMDVELHPGVVFYHAASGSLKFLRRVSDNWPPEMRVIAPPAVIGLLGPVMASTSAGSRVTLPFKALGLNFASEGLTIRNLTIDGPDAADFSISLQPSPPTVFAGGEIYFRVDYAPQSPGRKTATLHVVSNASNFPGFCDIPLTGETLPELRVISPGSTAIFEGDTLYLPFVPPGSDREFTVTLRNAGVAELRDLSVTIDGADAGAFSIVKPPAATVVPAGTTTFTLRHMPSSQGVKTGSLHIANNLPGGRNPFVIPVRAGPGGVDFSFLTPAQTGIKGGVFAIGAGGSILLSSQTSVLDRIHPDGSMDTSFFPPAIDVTPLRCAVPLRDGKILIGGKFTRVAGLFRPGLARLMPDGSLDGSFAPLTGESVNSLAVEADGKIIVCTASGEIVRLMTDGSRDNTFAVLPGTAFARIPSGGFVYGGRIRNENGYPLTLVDPAGDSKTLGRLTSPVDAITPLPDGSFVVTAQSQVVRMNPQGSILAFPPFLLGTSAVLPRTDGACMVLSGNVLRRVTPDGEIDPDFAVEAARSFRSAILQADGGAVCAGQVIESGGGLLQQFTRVTNDSAVSLLQTVNHSAIRWMRSGSSPELSDVSFELKKTGSEEWTALGLASRIDGGWQLGGLALPPGVHIRALGRAGVSLIEEILYQPSPLESWRLQHFNTSDSTGDAANDADPDHDGLTNFTEFAFGLNPVDRSSNTPPEFKYANGSFTSTFTAPEGTENVVYGAEWSATMLPGTWVAIPDTGTAPVHFFKATAGQRVFVRYRLGVR